MISKSKLTDGQWYWGTVEGATQAARWDGHQELFVYAKREPRTSLLAPAIPDSFVFAAYYEQGRSHTFHPIDGVVGPQGDWKPEQGVMLTNNLRALYNVDLGGL